MKARLRVPALALALILPSADALAAIARVPASLPARSFAPAAAAPAAVSASVSASALAAAPASAPKAAAAALDAAAEAAAGPVAAAAAQAGESAASALQQLKDVPAAWAKPVLEADSAGTPAPVPAGPKDSVHDKSIPLASHDFGRMFELTRRILTRPAARKFLKEAFGQELALSPEEQERYGLPEQIKDVSESQLMLLLALNPHAWKIAEQYLGEIEKAETRKSSYKKVAEKWTQYFQHAQDEHPEIAEKFKALNDPTRPMSLERPDGRPGYSNQRVYANHVRLIDGKLNFQGDDLKKTLIDFIGGAKNELMFNVFDFDLMDVADAMVAAANRGVKVTGGIYAGTIEERPDVKAVFERLSSHKNITMRAVDSVGLNHQKLVIRDWSDEKLAASLLSSGNFTQSCIGPEGDLRDLPIDQRDKKTLQSIPNANHMIVLDGYLPAQVIANKLTQTLVMGLRGKEYPLGGAFKIFGPKQPGMKEAPFIVLSFSPRGTNGDVSRDMIRRLILETRGPLRAMVFAFSSPTVKAAILERARREIAEGRQFDFAALGDTPFTMRDYSVLLHLSGLEVKKTKAGKKEYLYDEGNELLKIVGKENFDKVQAAIRVAPRAYGEHASEHGKFNAKIHHKVFISGDWAIMGTSFNPSDNAESNTEQILLTNDPVLVGAIRSAFDGLYAQTPRSVYDEAVRRNGFNEVSNDVIEKKYEHVDAEAKKKRRAKKAKKTASLSRTLEPAAA